MKKKIYEKLSMKVVEIKHRKHLLQARQKTPSNEIPDYDDWIE